MRGRRAGTPRLPPGPPPAPGRLLQTLLGREEQARSPLGHGFPLGLQAKRPAAPGPGIGRTPAKAGTPRGSGHTLCPGIPAANKTCCERAVWPAGSLTAFPGMGEGSETWLRGSRQHPCRAPTQPRSPSGCCLRGTLAPVTAVPSADMECLAGLGPGSLSLIPPVCIILRPLMQQQKCGSFNSHTLYPVTGRVFFIFRKSRSNISQSYFSILSSPPSLPVHPCKAHVSFTGYEDALCIPEFDPKITW